MSLITAIKTTIYAAAAAAVLTAFFGNVAAAQTPAGMSVLARYAPTQFKPEVVSGRIVGRSMRDAYPQINVAGERLSVQASAEQGEQEMIYDGLLRAGPFRGAKLSVLLDTAGRLEIERGAAEKGKAGGDENRADAYMLFVQKPGKPIVFTLGTGAARREIRAATVWELLIAYPEECRQHLLPILYTLRPGWNLLLAAEQVKSNLLQLAAAGPASQDALWLELVGQLGRDDYAVRDAADRRLREAGRQSAAFLKKLDKAKLDAEQRLRVARILRDFAEGEQSPREIAEEFFGDPQIWLAVARSDEEPARCTAKGELQRLLKAPITFDPAADRATRGGQLQKIEKSIGNALSGGD